MNIFTESLDVATFVVVLVSLWIRRWTWQYKWEQPKTLGLALMAVGTGIKAPPMSWLVDHDVLHGLYLLVAHVFILGGIGAMAYSAECKLRSNFDMCKWRVKFIITPFVIGVASMTALFLLYRLSSGYTSADWFVYDVMIIYFLSVCVYSLWCLFYDPASRLGAGIYLLAVGCGFVAAVSRFLLIVVNDHIPDMLLINVSSTAQAIALTLFAGGAAWMWKLRLREMNRRCSTKRTVEK